MEGKQKVHVSTHSRLKAAGPDIALSAPYTPVSTHSRLKAAGKVEGKPFKTIGVSTHSRLKAAGVFKREIDLFNRCFNTQPPEGGWSLSQKPCSIRFRSPDFAKLPRKARTRV